MERKEGYYWVIYKGELQVSEFDDLGWWITASELLYSDVDFDHINETRIPAPDEVGIVVDAVKLLSDVHQMD